MKFSTLAIEYLRYIQFDKNFREQTMRTRRQRLGAMVLFWIEKEIEALTVKDITAFKQAMLERKCQPSYINTFLQILKCFLKYCIKIHRLPVMNIKDIERLTEPKKKINYLTKEEVHELLRFFDKLTLSDYRNRALVAVILDSGLRISECLSLNRSQLDDIMHGACVIQGKFAKERLALFTWSREYIIEYLQKRFDEHEALFVAHCLDYRWRTHRLKADGVAKWLRQAGNKLGFLVNAHKLRKTALNNWKQNGMDLKSVSELAGHDSVKTTEKYYIGIDWAALKQKHKLYSNY